MANHAPDPPYDGSTTPLSPTQAAAAADGIAKIQLMDGGQFKTRYDTSLYPAYAANEQAYRRDFLAALAFRTTPEAMDVLHWAQMLHEEYPVPHIDWDMTRYILARPGTGEPLDGLLALLQPLQDWEEMFLASGPSSGTSS